MAFQIFVPTTRGSKHPGVCTVHKNGIARFHSDDARRAGISDKLVILVDASTHRIAMRKPREDEPTVKARWDKTRTAMEVSVGAALRFTGRDYKNGIKSLPVMHKDDMLILMLAEAK